MARTIRKQYTRCWSQWSDAYAQGVCERRGITVERYNKHFTTDHYAGRINAPAWFRRDITRTYRSKANHALRSAIIRGVEDPDIPIDIKCAAYLWW